MHCLERLYLSHNEFEEISRNITELSHLTTLDLSHNHIQYLPLTMSWTNSRMSKLSLAYNNLTTLTHALEEEQTYSRSGSHAINKEKEGERRNRGFTTFTYVLLTICMIACTACVYNVIHMCSSHFTTCTMQFTFYYMYCVCISITHVTYLCVHVFMHWYVLYLLFCCPYNFLCDIESSLCSICIYSIY